MISNFICVTNTRAVTNISNIHKSFLSNNKFSSLSVKQNKPITFSIHFEIKKIAITNCIIHEDCPCVLTANFRGKMVFPNTLITVLAKTIKLQLLEKNVDKICTVHL